jgi:hypothetical protein
MAGKKARDKKADETAPIAFMVMPFGRKEIDSTHPDAPSVVDFDALWHGVHEPVLTKLGYRPVRADSDLGALIVDEMVQRLTIADLVVADISLPNANVYYEIGVRHAAQRRGCVLVAAHWARPVFDLDQMRRLTYPLSDGACGEVAVKKAKKVLRQGLPELEQGGSPVFTAVPGYPSKIDRSRLSAFEDVVDELSTFQEIVRTIKCSPSTAERRTLTETLLRELGSRSAVRTAVVVELVGLARDHLGPEATVRYIDKLPKALQRHPPVIEQKQIALAKMGDVGRAAAALENLIEHVGPSADRCGILGGRYKQLAKEATDDRERRAYLDRAIAAYEQGMAEDLNEYYPSSNLPRLYRRRADPGDEQKARDVATVVMAACRRALARDPGDEWVVLTLLGAAFDRGDAEEADTLVTRIERAGVANFHLGTTVADLRASCALQPDDVEAPLRPVLRRVEELLPTDTS